MLIGKRVILDAVERQDLEWMRYQRNDPEFRKYFREYKDLSSDHQEDWFSNRANNKNPDHIYWKIMKYHEKYSGQEWDKNALVGCCALTYINWVNRRAELSIFVSRQEQGSGYAKEAIELMYDYAFDELNLHSIYAECYDNNKAVTFYTGVIGMKQDGLVRDTYFHNGKYGNSHILTILEDEWRERRKI